MIEQFLEDWNPKHTDFQCDKFITEKSGITLWGHYRQALREFVTRIGASRDAIAECALNQLDLEELQKTAGSDRRSAIEAWKLSGQIALQKRKISRLLQELARFYAQCKALKAVIPDFGNPEMEEHHWYMKFRTEAGFRVLSGQPVGADLIRSAHSLPERLCSALLTSFANPQSLAAEFANYKPLPLPKISAVPSPEKMLRLLNVPDDYFSLSGFTNSARLTASDTLEVSANFWADGAVLYRSQ
jgi:hypothetical protein